MSPVPHNCPFSVVWSNPRYHMASNRHVSLVSFDLCQFLSIFLLCFIVFLMTLTVLKGNGQFGFAWYFLMIRLRAWEKNTMKVKGPSHCIISDDTYQHDLLPEILTLTTRLRGCLPIELLFFCTVIIFLFLYSILWEQVTKSSPRSKGNYLSTTSWREAYQLSTHIWNSSIGEFCPFSSLYLFNDLY